MKLCTVAVVTYYHVVRLQHWSCHWTVALCVMIARRLLDLLLAGHKGAVHGRKDVEAEVVAVPHKTVDVVSAAR